MITETTITEDSDAMTNGQGFHLLVMSPEFFASYPLPKSGSLTIGRSSKCAVRVEDPMASREHARIHTRVEADGTIVFAIEDCGSANGTRVREAAVTAGESIPVFPGEGMIIGSTVIMVLQDRPSSGPRRLWSHAYFDARVEDECARAAKNKATFALARLRYVGVAPWTKILPILARDLPAPHGFATYGPKEYEILFLDVKESEAEATMQRLVELGSRENLQAQYAVAWYPKNGRSSDALIASANSMLRARGGKLATNDTGTQGAGMRRVREMAARAASSVINVLIVGETGVGKDVLARLIHSQSQRANKPFVALNCAGFSDTLFESELFGYEKGAFTGAAGAKVGLFESANGGTIFLDEIGDMPLPLQAKLLRVLETREVRPLGAVRSRPVDIRFISATNKDLERAVVNGEFRRDLMYRLNGITLAIPELRHRVEEIPVLVESFIEEGCRDGAHPRPHVTSEAMSYLVGYHWPGNIRELKNEIERALVLCDGSEIRPEHLTADKLSSLAQPSGDTSLPTIIPVSREDVVDAPWIGDPVKTAERQRIIDALVACTFNQTRAAQRLGMARRTFVSKLECYRIPRPQKGYKEDVPNETPMRPRLDRNDVSVS